MLEISELIIILSAILAGFFVQTITGFAANLLMLPILLFVFELPEAIAFVSIYFALFSIVLVCKNWQNVNWRIVIKLGVGIIVGTSIGVKLLTIAEPVFLKRVLGAFILAYAIYTGTKHRTLPKFPGAALVLGGLSGFFSGLFASGGAIAVAYIFNEVKKKEVLRATIIGALTVTNLYRLPALIYGDILTNEIWVKAAYALPAFGLAIWLGHKAHRKIDEEQFKKLILILLVVSAIVLLIK